MSDTKGEDRDDAVAVADTAARVRVIPLEADLERATRPFQAAAGKKCYVIFDKGPPVVMTEVDCGDIVIVDPKAKFV